MDKALWEQENDPANAQRDLAQPPIHPPGVFQMILRRERRRADRDGSTFALAVFVVSPTKLNGKTREIAGKIKEKTRSIDEIGWLDWEKLGVLLPATDLEGGRMFSRRVLEAIPEPASVRWEVFAYPSPSSRVAADERTGATEASVESKEGGPGTTTRAQRISWGKSFPGRSRRGNASWIFSARPCSSWSCRRSFSSSASISR